MRCILHVGLPKCLSTSLQARFRDEPAAHFMGVGPSKFVCADVLDAVQTQILRTPAPYYDADAVRRVFERQLEAATAAGAQAAVLSDEAIPVNIGHGLHGVSFAERLTRLRDALGEDTVVLLVLRHPLQLLSSLYRYWVVHYGLGLSYRLYVQHLLVKGMASHLALLDYWAIAQQLRLALPTVQIALFEDLVARSDALSEALSPLGLDVGGTLGKENAGEPEAVVAEMLRLNQEGPSHGIPHAFNDYTPIETRRIQSTPSLFGPLVEAHTRRTVLHQTQLLAARSLAQSRGATLDESLSTTECDLLLEHCARSNRLLVRDFGVDLKAHGYPL